MSDIGMFVGSSTGVTMEVGKQIRMALGDDRCDLYDLEDDYMGLDQILAYDTLIFGCSTWGAGEVQFNWVEPLEDLANEKPDFTGKTIALFGAGDCVTHGEQFVSALGVLHDKFLARGASFIAAFPSDGYTFECSQAVRDGKFVGFPFDQVNEKAKTLARLGRWLDILESEIS